MRTSVIVLSVVAVCQMAVADVTVVNPNGMLEASSVSELQEKVESSGAGGLVLGNGMLKWTGTGTSVWNGTYTSAPVSNLEVTVNVTDPDATLKIAGTAVAQENGVFIKSGPGTAEFNGGGVLGAVTGSTPWDAGWWKTYDGASSATFQAGLPVWDETTGIVSGYGYSTFSVLEGTLRLNAPGKTFNIPTTPWVGGRLQASPRLEITNGTAAVSGSGVFSIARGTGTKTNTEAPVVSITDGGSLQVAQLSMGYSHGDANHYSRGRLELDHGTFTTAGTIEQPQSSGKPVIAVTNGSFFNHTRVPQRADGWTMNSDAEAYFASGSTGVTKQVAFKDGTKLEVADGATFKLDRIYPSFYNSVNLGVATTARIRFDDATLTRATDVIGAWFGNRGNGYTNFVVGANGMTMEADGPVWFGADPVAESDDSTIIKTGSDTLFTRPFTNVAVAVAEGTLGMTTQNSVWTNDSRMARTFAAGTKLLVAEEGALGGTRIDVPQNFTAEFLGNGKVDNAEWVCNLWARWLFDGTLQMTVGNATSHGAAWRKEKIAIDKSFTVTFDSFSRLGDCSVVEPYYGWALVFQNKGTDRYDKDGSDGNNLGYSGDNVVSGVNYGFTADGVKSIAIGVDVKNARFRSGRNGAALTAYDMDATVGVKGTDLAASVRLPCRNVFTYDAQSHKAMLTVFLPTLKRTVSYEETVDLVDLIGDTTAYVGFTAAQHGNRNCEHCIRNFGYQTGLAPTSRAVLHTGGILALGNGGTLKASLAGNESIGTFAVDEIAGADTTTLDVDDAGVYPADSLPPLVGTDPECWNFSENGYMADEGPACSPGAKLSGGFASKTAYPITGDWTLSYDWKSGNSGSLADVMFFLLDNRTAIDNQTSAAGGLRFRITMYGTRADGKTGDIFKVMLEKKAVAQQIGPNGSTTLDLSVDENGAEWFSLKNKGDLHAVFAYDDTAKKLAITLSQQDGAVSHTITLENFDAVEAFGSRFVRFRGWQAVGGLYAKGIFANIAWMGADYVAMTSAKPNSELAVAKLSGATAVVKKGTAGLAFLEPGQWNVPLTVQGGSLRFVKEPLEDIVVGAGGGWIFNQPSGCYTVKGGVKIGTDVNYHADVAQLRHRVRVSGKWKASWTLRGINTSSGETIAFFIHNDPRGNNIVGTYPYAATHTIDKKCGIGWHVYRGDTTKVNKMCFVTNGNYFKWAEGVSQSPVDIINGGDMETLVEYDGAGTVKVTVKQGANEFTHTQNGFDVKASVGGDYAYLGFGTGGGGARAYPSFDDFKFELLDSVDTLADVRYLPSLAVDADSEIALDSSVENGSFLVADELAVADGKTLRVRAPRAAAVLKTGTLTLGEGVVLSGGTTTAIAPDALAGATDVLTVDGTTLGIPSADIAAGTFAQTTVNLSNGAKLKLPAGTCSFDRIYVDCVKVKRGVYSAATCNWIVGEGIVDTSRGSIIILR